MKIIDISPEISESIAVWPGDTPYSREVTMNVDEGDHLGLSKVTTTLHLGAHTDAPNHYVGKSKGISERSLHYYLGPCQVISCKTKSGQRVQLNDLETQDIKAPRILLKTNSFPNPNQWNEDFCSLSEDLVDEMARQHVLLLGIDTPSIDPFQSKALEAHHKIAEHNMAILEGIVLTDVSDGLYTLHALPLKLKDGDASPVRAVLTPL
jgi:arylformamidase